MSATGERHPDRSRPRFPPPAFPTRTRSPSRPRDPRPANRGPQKLMGNLSPGRGRRRPRRRVRVRQRPAARSFLTCQTPLPALSPSAADGERVSETDGRQHLERGGARRLTGARLLATWLPRCPLCHRPQPAPSRDVGPLHHREKSYPIYSSSLLLRFTPETNSPSGREHILESCCRNRKVAGTVCTVSSAVAVAHEKSTIFRL